LSVVNHIKNANVDAKYNQFLSMNVIIIGEN